MNDIARSLAHVRDRVSITAAHCGRSSEKVTLLAVSKTKPASAIREAITAGQCASDEDYVQEGVDKIRYLQEKDANDLRRHFIGPLQSNESRLATERFDWCHTIDRLYTAAHLSEQCPAELPSLNILIQINISDEDSKSGILLARLDTPVAEVAALPRITLRGPMAIPTPESDHVRQFGVTQQMAVAFAGSKTCYPGTDALSLGVSDDIDVAITAGSTMVRIGTTIFGAHDYTKKQGKLRNTINMLTFLLSIVIEPYTMALPLHVWMQWSRCDFYNLFSQLMVRVTQPIIGPLRRTIPPIGPINSASALVVLVLSFIKAIILLKVTTFQSVIWIAAVPIVLRIIGLLTFWMLLVIAIMSWVSQDRGPVEYVLI